MRFRVRRVKGDVEEWGNDECEKVGKSLSAFIRTRRSGEKAVGAWRYQYKQVSVRVRFEFYVTFDT